MYRKTINIGESDPLKKDDREPNSNHYPGPEDRDFEIDEMPTPPEADFAPLPPQKRGPFLKKFPTDAIRLPLFFVFMFASVSYSYWNTDYQPYLFASQENIFQDGEYYRLFTSLMVHADVQHLLANFPLFFIFATLLNGFFRPIVFPVTALLVGVAASVSTLYFYDPHVRLIGASGMVFGMVAMWLTFYLVYDLHRTIYSRLFRASGFALLLLLPTTFEPQTSYLAHAFGFFYGVIAALFLIMVYGKDIFSEPEENIWSLNEQKQARR